MTKLSKPVRREVSSLHHGPLVVTLTEEGLYLRFRQNHVLTDTPRVASPGSALPPTGSVGAPRKRA